MSKVHGHASGKTVYFGLKKRWSGTQSVKTKVREQEFTKIKESEKESGGDPTETRATLDVRRTKCHCLQQKREGHQKQRNRKVRGERKTF